MFKIFILCRFYKSSKTQPSANLVFLLASGGHFNYFGTKKWLEDHLDTSSISELLSDVKFSICLDSLGNVDVSEARGAAAGTRANLNMHVSKPPKEDSHAGKFLAALKSLAEAEKAANRSSPVDK